MYKKINNPSGNLVLLGTFATYMKCDVNKSYQMCRQCSCIVGKYIWSLQMPQDVHSKVFFPTSQLHITRSWFQLCSHWCHSQLGKRKRSSSNQRYTLKSWIALHTHMSSLGISWQLIKNWKFVIMILPSYLWQEKAFTMMDMLSTIWGNVYQMWE